MKEYNVIALVGNPNVGKSTVFNLLTGLKQHTGNWPGKTVGNASGEYIYNDKKYIIYDLPGTYSLISHSKEEEIARDFICFEQIDKCVVVCDALCLERNLNLVLQILEITKNVVVVVNLLDEAKKKKVRVNLEKLSEILGVEVVGASARSGIGIKEIEEAIEKSKEESTINVSYGNNLEKVIFKLQNYLEERDIKNLNSRWLALRLIENDMDLIDTINRYLQYEIIDSEIEKLIKEAHKVLLDEDVIYSEISDYFVSTINKQASLISSSVIMIENKDYDKKMRKIDSIVTNKITGIPLMLLLLMVVFWITIIGSSYPSDFLFDLLFYIGDKLKLLFEFLHVPSVITSVLVMGVYRVLAWVVAVMLPPMAIFFPLFTILEDLGYLPRIAFNLDNCFRKCKSCGKQALTMCMGFGCNAAGVTGARIIDSKRERLVAILTNNFVPCNGRFPTIISIITMFLVGAFGYFKSLFGVLILSGVIVFGIFMTFAVSFVLSKTLLKGETSSFTLELPPYRRPQIIKVIVRSIYDKTLILLMRAIKVAAPAGLVIWILSNVSIGDSTLLNTLSNFFDPFGKLIGLDGVIILSFLLGFPANEIVIPIMIMCYMKQGNLTQINDLNILKNLFISNGWTINTAICVIIFTMFHFPCSTTCLTIKNETGSLKWTFLSMVLPTLIGIILCFLVTTIFRLV